MSNKKYIYAPEYYKSFRCIADKCRHSCCVDWEICIDSKTLAKYKKLAGIMDSVTECEGEYCFRLLDNGSCPHLNERGLCDIIINYGEEYLSDICKDHPRFFSDVSSSRREAGIGIVCEEALRLILENDKPFSLVRIGEEDSSDDCGEYSYDALPERDRIISIIEESPCLDGVMACLKDAYRLPALYRDASRFDFLLSLEILDSEWESLITSAKEKDPEQYDKAPGFDKYFLRLLTYFVFRHISTAASFDNLRARLEFSLFSVETIRSLFLREDEKTLEALAKIARLYSSEIEYSEDNTAEIIFEFEAYM